MNTQSSQDYGPAASNSANASRDGATGMSSRNRLSRRRLRALVRMRVLLFLGDTTLGEMKHVD